MSEIIRDLPMHEMIKLIEKIHEGKINAWLFVTRSVTLDQRISDGEPITTFDVNILYDGMDPGDLRYIAQKLMEKADTMDPELARWR